MCVCVQLKVQMTDKPNTTVNFRKLLLNRCQKEFTRHMVFERKQKELDSAASVRIKHDAAFWWIYASVPIKHTF